MEGVEDGFEVGVRMAIHDLFGGKKKITIRRDQNNGIVEVERDPQLPLADYEKDFLKEIDAKIEGIEVLFH